MKTNKKNKEMMAINWMRCGKTEFLKYIANKMDNGSCYIISKNKSGKNIENKSKPRYNTHERIFILIPLYSFGKHVFMACFLYCKKFSKMINLRK